MIAQHAPVLHLAQGAEGPYTHWYRYALVCDEQHRLCTY